MTTPSHTDRICRIAFWSLSILLLVLMPILSLQHGQSGDEWSLILYGNDIYDYFFHGSQKAIDYDVLNWKQVEGLHYYGGLYDFTVTFLYKTFFSGFDELSFRHVINSLIGAGLLIYTGLLGKRLAGWRVGLLALVFLALSPRILGEAMNNPKDIPFAFANVFFLYYLLSYLFEYPKNKWKYTFLMALGFGLGMGFRIGGLILIPYFVLFTAAYYFLNKPFRDTVSSAFSLHARSIGLTLAIVVVIGYVIGIAFWPWALQEPLSRPFEALTAMTQRQIFLPMLFEGEYISNDETPWYYIPKWIFISNPVWILLSFIAGIVCLRPILKRYGQFEVFVLYFTLIFPWAYSVYKHSVVYDSWRHFFFIYPSLVLLAALLCNWVLEWSAGKKAFYYGFTALIILSMLLPFTWIARSNPNEYVYFNELIGGPEGAKAQYDFDYYQNGGKQMAVWIKEHAPKKNGKIIVRSDLSGIEKYFAAAGDTGVYNAGYLRYSIRDTADWDYFISYSRYQPVAQLENDFWPPANAVYIIKAGTVPIGAVLERKSKGDLMGFRALSQNDYNAATTYFAEYLKTDPNNEMILPIYGQLLAQQNRFPEALEVLDKAKQINPEDTQIPQVINSINAAMQTQPAPAPQPQPQF